MKKKLTLEELKTLAVAGGRRQRKRRDTSFNAWKGRLTRGGRGFIFPL